VYIYSINHATTATSRGLLGPQEQTNRTKTEQAQG